MFWLGRLINPVASGKWWKRCTRICTSCHMNFSDYMIFIIWCSSDWKVSNTVAVSSCYTYFLRNWKQKSLLLLYIQNLIITHSIQKSYFSSPSILYVSVVLMVSSYLVSYLLLIVYVSHPYNRGIHILQVSFTFQNAYCCKINSSLY